MLKKTEKENILIALEKMRKEKKIFEWKKKRYKLCLEETDVKEELKIVWTAAVNKGFVRGQAYIIYLCITIITIKRCWHTLINKFYLVGEVGSCNPLTYCGFCPILFLHICEFFKLCSRKQFAISNLLRLWW